MATLENKTDGFNFFSMSNRKNNSYNYSKISDKIEKINEVMNLHLTTIEMQSIKTKKSSFVDCKTKGQSTESKIKKSIRAKYQKFCIAMDECKDEPTKKQFAMQDKILQDLLF